MVVDAIGGRKEAIAEESEWSARRCNSRCHSPVTARGARSSGTPGHDDATSVRAPLMLQRRRSGQRDRQTDRTGRVICDQDE